VESKELREHPNKQTTESQRGSQQTSSIRTFSARLAALSLDRGLVWSVPLERDLNDPAGQRWIGSAPNIPANARYVLQAVDEAGNVALAMNKGDYIPLNYETQFIYLPVVLRDANGSAAP